jgi:lipopolysaccharide transport system ATP-binding protein
VGTGFHPELTGRENVYLNGAILGMKRKEIKCKFDEIVDFSGVERFIDTPVKHYSSGMQVRLAFAVAAHLEPEILIVDEVLAVGDAEFQKKCLGKMQDATGQGRTVLFVSHNMGSIEKLCTKAGCLEQGQLTLIDTPTNVIAAYLNNTSVNNYQSDNIQIQDRDIWIKQIVISQGQDKAAVYLDPRQPVEIHLTYEVLHPLDNLLLGFDVFSSDGTHLFRTYDLEGTGMQRDVGYYVSVLSLPAGVFQSTSYYLELLVGLHRIRWISRGKFAVKLDFREARMVDVTHPGALKTLGSWNVLMQEALP